MATKIEIVLRTGVNSLGSLGQKVSVSSGYARNFLIPKGLAVFANDPLAPDLQKKYFHSKIKQRLAKARPKPAKISKSQKRRARERAKQAKKAKNN